MIIDAAQINKQLSANGYYEVPIGITKVSGTIKVRAKDTIRGFGFRSVLESIDSDYIIEFGDNKESIYGAYLQSFSVNKAGIKVNQVAQHCGINQVWISGSPKHGLLIDGFGEKMKFEQVISYGNSGDGIRVNTNDALNGLIFDNCNSQSNKGYGFIQETTEKNAQIWGTVIRDCTIQGNGDIEAAELGYVCASRYENVWIENPKATKLFYSDMKTFADVSRYPQGLWIGGNSVITFANNAKNKFNAIELRVSLNPVIDSCWIPNGLLAWNSDKGANWYLGQRPIGQLRFVKPEQISDNLNLAS